jgi:hypothetical protein
LSLLGLVRHLTEVEAHHLVHALSGDNRGFHYCTDENPEADIEHIDAGMVEDSMRRWHQERADAHALIAACTDPSAPTATGWNSVRWLDRLAPVHHPAMLALAVLTILAATAQPRPRPRDHRVDHRRDPPPAQRPRPHRDATASAHPAHWSIWRRTPKHEPAEPTTSAQAK